MFTLKNYFTVLTLLWGTYDLPHFIWVLAINTEYRVSEELGDQHIAHCVWAWNVAEVISEVWRMIGVSQVLNVHFGHRYDPVNVPRHSHENSTI